MILGRQAQNRLIGFYNQPNYDLVSIGGVHAFD